MPLHLLHQRFQVLANRGDIHSTDKLDALIKTLVHTVPYPANIVLTLCGDWLEDHILAANAEENLLNLVQEFLGGEKKDRK